jgi:hypothetical protein
MKNHKGAIILTLVIIIMTFRCSGPESDQPLLTAEMPLHLEEHLDKARIIGAGVTKAIQEPAEWDFSESQPDWKQAAPLENQGQRLSQPVSMIDILPTILDLTDLAVPEEMQGQSLAPLLLGEEGWEQRPVIFDEFYVDIESGELNGKIDVVDGQWGASLRIGKDIEPGGLFPPQPRPAPLLLYDVWNDPYCLHSLHEGHPDLVKKYTKFLQTRWKEHLELGKRFTRSTDVPLTSEQLQTLRALGYIR